MVSEKPKATLYDFLYIDNDRVKSLYSQLFSGLLSAIENVASETISKKTDVKIGGSPVGSLSREIDKKEIESSLDRLDPHDLILRDVLQGLLESGNILSDISEAQPGNIILLNGQISILNFETYKHFIAMMPHLMQAGETPSPESPTQKKHRKHFEKEEKKKQESVLNIIKGFSDIVPWGIQVIMESTDGIDAWGALKTDNLRDAPGNLTLKYGPTLSGRWYMLAIVDIVGAVSFANPLNLSPQIIGLMEAGHGMRGSFGRPDNQIGVTPLLIFRKLL